ncbi:hypothetical protein GGS24DRAFT_379277 [Hypoxylon argillaceum]|nr:hypothetical protein GGS24DRAFT_379277 [Hypoxylon argillaceum]
MDLHHPPKCKWEGCRSYNVVAGSEYCLEHKGQYHRVRPLQPDKGQAFLTSSSNPRPGLLGNPTTTRIVNRSTENGPMNKPPPSGTTSPTKEKKLLSDKHTARKSVKQPPILGQPHVASPTSPVRGPSIDIQSSDPRPAKKQRLSSIPNVSELYSRSESSSFSENGIPHPSKRGMFRQSEERTYRLSAVDDFALRPKKKEATNESARSKAYSGLRQLHRGESHLSSSSRQTPPSSRLPQSAGHSGSARSSSLVIDLTVDDDLQPPLPRLKPQPSPKNPTPNGIEVGQQKPQRFSNGNRGLACEGKELVVLENKQRRDGPLNTQPSGVPQIQQRRFVGESSNPHTQKPPENVISDVPTVQATLKPANGISSETSISKQMPHSLALKNGTGSVHYEFSRNSTQEASLPTKENHSTNGTRQFPLNEKNAAPVNSAPGTSERKEMAIKKITKSIVRANPIPATPITPELEASRVTLSHSNTGRQVPVQGVDHAPTPPIDEHQPITIISQGPLSAALGGRVWKKMSPEERRLFWVSQHDPEKLDAQIYSENNRPFRPGDDLFGVADDALPLRPKRPATHFDYINPRTHYSHQESEALYLQKQKEFPARGNRKTRFGEAIKRGVLRKQAAPKPSQKQKRDKLPQRVRDNPKWLAALDVLERLESQARDKSIINELSFDADIESS